MVAGEVILTGCEVGIELRRSTGDFGSYSAAGRPVSNGDPSVSPPVSTGELRGSSMADGNSLAKCIALGRRDLL